MNKPVFKMILGIYGVYAIFLALLILSKLNESKKPLELKKTVIPSLKKDTLIIKHYEKTIN